jgi:hypothetical protein
MSHTASTPFKLALSLLIVFAATGALLLGTLSASADSLPLGAAFTHGSLTLVNDHPHDLFALSELAPGQQASARLRVTDTGTLSGHLSLTATAAGVGQGLRVRVYRGHDGGRPLYAGSLAGLRAVKAGLIGAGQSAVFYLHLSRPQVVRQSGWTTPAFTFTATQV